MKNITHTAFFLIIIAFASFAGIWIGQNTLSPKKTAYEDIKYMHSFFHDELNITAQQEKEIAKIEREFKHLEKLYKTQMKTANMELAQAIKEGSYESPEIEEIVHKIHQAMGKLQSLSLKHLSDMQKILDKQQSQKLREMVVEQLRRNAGE